MADSPSCSRVSAGFDFSADRTDSPPEVVDPRLDVDRDDGSWVGSPCCSEAANVTNRLAEHGFTWSKLVTFHRVSSNI